MFQKKRLKVNILFWAAIALCTSCDTNMVFHSYRSVPVKGWSKSDTLRFTFPVTDSLSFYRVTLEIRNEDLYPYQELYLFIHRPNTRDSALMVTDTLRCLLSDSKGDWAGIGFGAIYQSVHPYADLPILYTGEYKMSISHGMKEALLFGIDDVGIKVEKIR